MKIWQVDSFTDTPFRGNPAGVCLLEAERPEAWMLGAAAEINLSETAFVLAAGGRHRLRWFTPTTEVSLCGHATLAAAHVLWESGDLPRAREVVFDTRSGALTARSVDRWIEMDFPIRRVEPCAAAEPLNRALGVSPLSTARRINSQGAASYLLELSSEAEVRAIAPDFAALRATEARSVIVTARADTPPFDFVSRFFAPSIGIDEDPVTGSAHCYLAPYWAKAIGKTDLLGLQVSRRGGVVGCSPRGERVLLRGQAVSTIRGEILA